MRTQIIYTALRNIITVEISLHDIESSTVLNFIRPYNSQRYSIKQKDDAYNMQIEQNALQAF